MWTGRWLVAGVVLGLVAGCASKQELERRDEALAVQQRVAVADAAQAAPQAVMARREAVAQTQRAYAMPPPAPYISHELYMPIAPDREQYAAISDNAVQRAQETPVSTFSIDVDTGAYANTRRFLRQGRLPPEDAVRVEELVNYFDYAYAPPRDRAQPFSVHAELAPTPWNRKTQLLRIGLQGWKPQGPLPPANLVFLVDVSGSMHSADKLPLVKAALKLLTRELTAQDRVSIVSYASGTRVVLEPTPGDNHAAIAAALEELQAGGGTHGSAGLQLAYATARKAYIENGINRVLLATDGDFNLGVVGFDQLKDYVERERRSGVAMSTLGFGSGNYNDRLMEQIADAGNGNYTYVDSLEEARRALVESRAATLMTIAADVKIQVEFNPAMVAEYRLIGYENRALRREDFSNDQVDAGEIGAGHSVTALYEVALVGSGGERIEALRYGAVAPATQRGGEIAHLRLRYKRPGEDASQLIERVISAKDARASLAQASESLRFAAAVAAFGQKLRGGRYTGDFDYGDVLQLARGARGEDARGWRGEFLQLVELADALAPTAAAVPPSREGRGG